MCDRSIRRLTRAAVTLALAAVITSACGGPGMVPPLGPPPKPQPTQAQPTTGPAARSPTSAPGNCMGAVEHTINAGEAGPSHMSLCLTVGGVVRMENIGPEMLDADSWARVSCSYEAAVHTCRLIHTGTVRFKTSHPVGHRAITVEIAAAVSPPRPSTAVSLPCRYEAGVGECRFVEAATLTISVKRPDVAPRELIVVFIE